MLKKGGPFLLNESSADDLTNSITDPADSSNFIKQGAADQQVS